MTPAGPEVPFGGLLGDPAKGYNTAAAGAKQVSDWAKQFSQDQWNRQMEGLQGQGNAWNVAQNQFQNTYGARGTGAMENWWTQNQQKFSQPGAQQGAYGQFNNWMADPANNSTQAGATRANQYMSGPTASSGAYGAASPQLTNYSGPQAGADRYAANSGAYGQTGAGEDWYSQMKGAYTAPGYAQSLYGQAQNQLGQPGRSEAFQVNAPTNLMDNNAGRQSFANGQTMGAMGADENKGLIRNADQLSNYYQSQLGSLSGPGAYEQFVQADIGGYNPELERSTNKTLARINQEMARRGHFDSGGADVAIGEAMGEFQAKDYQNKANRAQQAQQMELGRISTGGGLAGQTSGLDVNRGQALAGIDQANEAAALARMQFGLGADQAASGEAMAGQRLGLDAAGQADRSQLDRLQGLSGMAGQADSARFQGLQLGQAAASGAGSQWLARMAAGQDAANSVDQAQLSSDQQALQRLLANFQMASGTDQANQTRADALFAQGQGIDDSWMKRFAMQQDGAQNLDQFNLAQLLGGGQMANSAQNAESNRYNDAMAAQMGISQGQAGSIGDAYKAGGALSGESMSDAWNALMAMFGYQGQGENARQQMPFDVLKQIVDGYKASQTGGAG